MLYTIAYVVAMVTVVVKYMYVQTYRAVCTTNKYMYVQTYVAVCTTNNLRY